MECYDKLWLAIANYRSPSHAMADLQIGFGSQADVDVLVGAKEAVEGHKSNVLTHVLGDFGCVKVQRRRARAGHDVHDIRVLFGYGIRGIFGYTKIRIGNQRVDLVLQKQDKGHNVVDLRHRRLVPQNIAGDGSKRLAAACGGARQICRGVLRKVRVGATTQPQIP